MTTTRDSAQVGLPAERRLDFARSAMNGDWLNGSLPDSSAFTFRGAAVDSRHVQAGQLFFALPGEQVNGFDFCTQAQVAGADELALNYGWASTVEHLVNLWLIALLAASRRPGSTLLALLVAACLLYLGVASIGVPGNPGSWGFPGGAIAIAGGATYLALTLPALLRVPLPPTG